METDIAQILGAIASRQPTAPALHVPGRTTLSYADLGAQIGYVRDRLAAWDVVRGDAIVGVIPARPEMALACVTIPAVASFAPLSPALTLDSYTELLTRLSPKLLIVSSGLDHPIRAAARRCGVAEVDLTADPGAPAGMFTLDLARQDESLTRRASSRPDWAYVLTTSGTTGRPKLVPISHRQLALYAQSLSDYLSVTTSDVGCHLQPLHHAHGLNSALLVPLLKGASLVCLQEFDIDGFFAALDEYQITWLTAVFTVHREILRRAPDFREAVARSRLRFLRVGSGQLKPDEIDRMERTFGAPLLMGFRMTEASSITHDPLPPRMRKRGAVGVPLCNQVALMSEAGALCATGDVGEVVVRGPLVFDGYFDDAQANAAAFVDGWFRTGDLGRFDDEGYLYLVGRIKDLINRGGEKISPVELDAALEAIPGVRAAAAFAMPHQSLGEEVVAAVVRNGDVPINASDIIDEMRRRIRPARVPRQIYFVDQLPRTDSGKVLRSALPRLLSLNQRELTFPVSLPVEVHASNTSPVEAALTGLWASALNIKHVGRNDHFLFLGGDSSGFASLITSVNALFGVDLDLESLSRDDMTVARMAREIEAIRARTAVDESPGKARRGAGPPPLIPRTQQGEPAVVIAVADNAGNAATDAI